MIHHVAVPLVTTRMLKVSSASKEKCGMLSSKCVHKRSPTPQRIKY